MADRKVSVGLKLEAGQYKAEATTVTAKTKGIDDAVTDLDRDITKIPPDAAKAAAAMKLLGGDADGLRGKLHDVGPEATSSFQLIDKRIDETRLKMRQAAEDFNRTGSAESFKLWQNLTNDHGELQRLRKNLAAALDDGGKDGGDRGGKSMVDGFASKLPALGKALGNALSSGTGEAGEALGKAFSALPPQAQVAIGLAIAGAITASAAFIGAALDGALLAGVGGGAIALGIAGQIHNPVVVGAAGRLKETLAADLKSASGAFGPVLLDIITKAGREMDKLEPGLEHALDRVAPSADRLLTAFLKLADEAAPGFEHAIDASRPVLDELANDLPALGRDVRVFFDLISDGSQGGADALGQLLKIVGFLIEATGAEVDMLSRMWQALEIGADIARGHLGQAAIDIATFKDGTHDASDEAHGFTDQLGLLGGGADSASGSLSQLNDAVLAFNNDAMDATSAGLSFKDSLASMTDALKQSKGSLDENSAAGRRAEEAYLAGVSAAQQHAAAVLKSSGSAVEAAKAYQQDKTALDNAAKAAGASKGQIDALNKSLDNTVKVRRGSVTITVSVKGNGQSLLTRSDSDITKILGTNLQFRASGGPVVPGQPYVVGEQGPELIVPDRPGVVVPHDTRFVSARQVSSPVGGTVGASMPGPSVTQNIYATQMDEARLAALVDRRLAAAGIR